MKCFYYPNFPVRVSLGAWLVLTVASVRFSPSANDLD